MPIGVAVVGAGYWGPNLIRTFLGLPDCEVRWVCDRKPGRLRFVQSQWPQLATTDDYGKVLADPTVAAVVIATPVPTHFDLATAAARAGKHLLVEKPLTRTSDEAQRLRDMAETRRLVLAAGHIFAYHPAVVAMKAGIAAGQIGDLRYAESGRVNLGPPASEVDVIWDLAVHDVSILLHLWERPPCAVTAFGRKYVHPTLVDVAFLHVEFEDGSMAQHHVSWLSPEKVRRFFVAGTKGSFRFDDTVTDGKLRRVDQGIDSRIGLKDDDVKELYYKPGEVTTPVLGTSQPLQVECQAFLDCIRRGGSPAADGAAGVAVVKVLEAAERSIGEGSRRVVLR